MFSQTIFYVLKCLLKYFFTDPFQGGDNLKFWTGTQGKGRELAITAKIIKIQTKYFSILFEILECKQCLQDILNSQNSSGCTNVQIKCCKKFYQAANSSKIIEDNISNSVTSEHDPSLHVSFVSQYQFWLVLVLINLGEGLGLFPAITLLDSATMNVLKGDASKFGKQRMWMAPLGKYIFKNDVKVFTGFLSEKHFLVSIIWGYGVS